MIYVIVKERYFNRFAVRELCNRHGYFTDKDKAQALVDVLESKNTQHCKYIISEIEAA